MNITEYQKILKEKLDKRIKLFEKASAEEKEFLLEDIDTLYNVIEGSKSKDEVIYFNSNYLLEELRDLEELKFFWPYFESISKIVPFYGDAISEKDAHLRFKQSLYLVDNFFQKDTPKRIRDLYNIIVKQKNVYPVDGNNVSNTGYSLFLYSGKEVIIQINPENTYSDVPVLAHEFGHGISFLDSNQFSNEIECFQEIISIFFQMAITEFYQKTPLYYEANDYLNVNISISVVLAKKLASFEKIYKISSPGLRQKELKKLVAAISEDEKDSFIENPALYSSKYIIGLFIAANLIMIYLNDREKAYHLVRKVIGLNSLEQAEEYLKRLENFDLMNPFGIIDYSNHLKRKLSN